MGNGKWGSFGKQAISGSFNTAWRLGLAD